MHEIKYVNIDFMQLWWARTIDMMNKSNVRYIKEEKVFAKYEAKPETFI